MTLEKYPIQLLDGDIFSVGEQFSHFKILDQKVQEQAASFFIERYGFGDPEVVGFFDGYNIFLTGGKAKPHVIKKTGLCTVYSLPKRACVWVDLKLDPTIQREVTVYKVEPPRYRVDIKGRMYPWIDSHHIRVATLRCRRRVYPTPLPHRMGFNLKRIVHKSLFNVFKR